MQKSKWLDRPDGEGFFWLKDPRYSGKDNEYTIACVSIYMLDGMRIMFHLIGYNCAFNQDDLLKPTFSPVKWKRIPKP
jgi:uncharacterized protein YwqG